MGVSEYQRDLRRAFVGGGPGTLISGLVWLAAALVERRLGIGPAFAVLFFGGMLIFPLALLACSLLFRRAKPQPSNPLGRVVLEGTIAMIGGLFAAWLFLPFRPDYVLPLAAVAVGTHYAVFRSSYGDWLFWLLGALVTAVGVIDIVDIASIPGGTALAVAAIEMSFAILLTVRASRPTAEVRQPV